MSDNCGVCPTTTTTNMAICTGNYTQLISDRPCSFAVRTAVCNGIVGDISIAITVTKAAGIYTMYYTIIMVLISVEYY